MKKMCSHRNQEQRENLASDTHVSRKRLCKTHKREVHSIERKFNAHEYKEDVAARKSDNQANGENHQGKNLCKYSRHQSLQDNEGSGKCF